MIDSFSDQETKHGLLFSNDTFSGLSLCTSLKPSQLSFARLQFDYLPVQAKIDSNVWGGNLVYNDLTKAQAVFIGGPKNGASIILQLGKSSSAGLMYATLLKPNLLASVKTEVSYENNPYAKCKYTPSIKAGMLTRNINMVANFVFPFYDKAYLDQFEITAGEDEISVGYKLFYDKVFNRNNYSILATYKDGINTGQTIMTLKSNYEMELRAQRLVKKDLYCGFNIKLTDNFKKPQLNLGWLTKVNGCDIHSTISTKGLVTSVFSTELRSGCVFVVSGSLDHAAHDYKLGIRLDWRNKK